MTDDPAGSGLPEPRPALLGLGLAAAGRPAYITTGRTNDLGVPADRTVDALRTRAHELLDTAWAAGIRFFDVARSYGLAEVFLGSWLAKHPGRRPEITIESKWGYEYVGEWQVDADIHERKDHSLGMFENQWPQTVRALDDHPPDVYLIHSVTPESPALSDPVLLDRLRELTAAGVRVGISTSGPSQGQVLTEAMALPDSPFRVVQATWNLLEQSAADALQRAHAAGWLVVVKEVLANGRLTDSLAPVPVREVARWANYDVAALAIGVALEQPWADVVLTGAVTSDQILANIGIRVPSSILGVFDNLATVPRDYWQSRREIPWT